MNKEELIGLISEIKKGFETIRSVAAEEINRLQP